MNKWGARLIQFPLVPVLRLEQYLIDQGGGSRSSRQEIYHVVTVGDRNPRSTRSHCSQLQYSRRQRYWETCAHHIRQKEEGSKSRLSFARKPVIQVTVRMAIGHILNPSDLLLHYHPLSSTCPITLQRKKVTY